MNINYSSLAVAPRFEISLYMELYETRSSPVRMRVFCRWAAGSPHGSAHPAKIPPLRGNKPKAQRGGFFCFTMTPIPQFAGLRQG